MALGSLPCRPTPTRGDRHPSGIPEHERGWTEISPSCSGEREKSIRASNILSSAARPPAHDLLITHRYDPSHLLFHSPSLILTPSSYVRVCSCALNVNVPTMSPATTTDHAAVATLNFHPNLKSSHLAPHIALSSTKSAIETATLAVRPVSNHQRAKSFEGHKPLSHRPERMERPKDRRPTLGTGDVEEKISRPGAVRINVKGAFIVDDEGSRTPSTSSEDGSVRGEVETKDIRLPNHLGGVSHIAVDVSILGYH